MRSHATTMTADPTSHRGKPAAWVACILALAAAWLLLPGGPAAGQSLDELLDLGDEPAPE